jgi:antitoxin component of MazEF toxin-antitoxin module
MVTRLKPDGNGFSLAIDRSLLEKLQIDSDTPLDVSIDGHRLIIQPLRDTARREEFDRIVADMNQRYEGMFKRLAE